MLRTLMCVLSILALSACASKSTTGPDQKLRTAREYSKAKEFKPGWLAIIQGATSSNETLINVMAPRLKTFEYAVIDSSGQQMKIEKYDSVHYAPMFYKVDKLHVTGLVPGVNYTLQVIDVFRTSRTVVDQREFSTLDLKSTKTTFATMSCMADDWRFEEVINPIWERLRKARPDFLIMSGDVVYVDSFAFVERKKATEQDLWQRYIDSLNRLPVYHFTRLIPILASWDDHDFGTNDGDREFAAKDPALRVFKAFFGGRDLPGTFENGPGGVATRFTGFGQNFVLMDNRYFRQANKEQKKQETFGHWGEKQHQWMIKGVQNSTNPTWIVNGNQIFNGKQLDFKEAMEANHPANYARLIEDLKKTTPAVAFISGDIHFSEVMRIPAERLGFETYELTSSAMHSYSGDGWENPLRLPGASTIEFNYLLVTSEVQNGALKIDVRSQGVSEQDLFKTSFEVKR